MSEPGHQLEDMIAPTDLRRKGLALGASGADCDEWFPRSAGKSDALARSGRHRIVSRNHNAAPLPPIDRPAELRKKDTALARSFRYRIPQPPAPRGREDRVYRRKISPILGRRELVLFSFQGVRAAVRIKRRFRDQCRSRSMFERGPNDLLKLKYLP